MVCDAMRGKLIKELHLKTGSVDRTYGFYSSLLINLGDGKLVSADSRGRIGVWKDKKYTDSLENPRSTKISWKAHTKVLVLTNKKIATPPHPRLSSERWNPGLSQCLYGL